ncbi:DUF6519 domain-containing protein [Kitasatospora aureofaciens]|uniref:DUF6519 domain-containing protein n=1 Tax=Kitasatospora aureofaciens TaxID=1894 RepID=UPI001C46F8B3|nr:DUF6519 domain-containing protein [Kitasatospora aureofaciens]MBV6696774.1 DUF4815 domain-containing protein [Kitasatospora aureofaciens]
MQGDFSRTTFDPRKHYSAVLAQQGRVQLDADLNEQGALLLHQLRTTIADLLGPAAAPAVGGGFAIDAVSGRKPQEDLKISAGRLYVDGILLENEADATYWTQPDLPLDPTDPTAQLPQDKPFVVYLRVWERLITALQDPAIREVALGDPGPDTAARAKTVWQVAALPVAATTTADALTEFSTRLAAFRPTGQLRARAKHPPAPSEVRCQLPPDSRFRGPENQLYRIEVHTGGPAWPAGTTNRRRGTLAGATFTWSRENASVVFPIASLHGAVATVTALGRDGKLGLEVGDWVELVDDTIAGHVADDVVLTDPPRPAPRLRQVLAIDAVDLLVTLDRQDGDEDCGLGAHPFLRRWDQRPTAPLADDGALPLVEGVWLDLEDGIQIWFQPGQGAKKGTYRRGDHWLVPARTATGDVLWPQGPDGPAAVDPDGVRYQYAPLAYVNGSTVDPSPRKTFHPLGS